MREIIFSSFLLILVVALLFLLVRHRRGRTTTERKGLGAKDASPTSDSQVAAPVEPEPPPSGPSQLDQRSPTQEQPPVLPEKETSALPSGGDEPSEQGAAREIPSGQPETAGPHTEPEVPIRESEGGKRLPPGKRGGRPRAKLPSQLEKTKQADQQSKGIGKPEIVCRKVERQWVLGVEVPDELLKDSLRIFREGELLSRDERIENFWLLCGVTGKVVISSDKGSWELDLNAEPLMFKIYRWSQNQGRLVKAPSVGSYLVVVPSDWQRDEHRSDPPRVEPEPVSIPGYRAHFFEITPSGGEIAFLKGDGSPFHIPKRSEIELLGERIPDANEFMGPLFRHPPRMCASPEVWKGIKEVVLGEEGPGKGKWRMSFTPEPKDEVDLPVELQRRKSGWYFLRFYDADDNLIDSLDFRFVSGLRAIRVPALNPWPARDGHQPVSIEILHEPGIRIRRTDSPAGDIRVIIKDEKTILTVPPDPRWDRSDWNIEGDTGRPVRITLLVERIWWNFGEENSVPTQCTDKLCDLTPDDFRAASKKALWIRLPKRRWVDQVKVGFAEAAARPYSVKVTEEWISIPLRDFTDCPEILEGDKDHALYVWFEGTQYRGTIGLLRAWQKRILCSACGRYKSSVAIARIRQGNGEIRVNGQNLWEYFKSPPHKGKDFMQRLLHIEHIAQALSQLSVEITVHGARSGGLRQIKASAHALARVLWSYQPGLKPVLRQQGFGGCKKIRGGSL